MSGGQVARGLCFPLCCSVMPLQKLLWSLLMFRTMEDSGHCARGLLQLLIAASAGLQNWPTELVAVAKLGALIRLWKDPVCSELEEEVVWLCSGVPGPLSVCLGSPHTCLSRLSPPLMAVCSVTQTQL